MSIVSPSSITYWKALALLIGFDLMSPCGFLVMMFPFLATQTMLASRSRGLETDQGGSRDK